jgi:hypothetical protein
LGVPPALLGDRLIEKSESLQLALTDRTGMSPLTVVTSRSPRKVEAVPSSSTRNAE